MKIILTLITILNTIFLLGLAFYSAVKIQNDLMFLISFSGAAVLIALLLNSVKK